MNTLVGTGTITCGDASNVIIDSVYGSGDGTIVATGSNGDNVYTWVIKDPVTNISGSFKFDKGETVTVTTTGSVVNVTINYTIAGDGVINRQSTKDFNTNIKPGKWDI